MCWPQLFGQQSFGIWHIEVAGANSYPKKENKKTNENTKNCCMWKICTMHCYRTIILVFVLSLSFQLFFFCFFRAGCVVYCPDINVFMPRHCCWRICCSCCCCSCNCSCCGRADCVLNCSGIKFCMHFIAVAAKQMTHMGNPIHFEYENSVPKCICSREL